MFLSIENLFLEIFFKNYQIFLIKYLGLKIDNAEKKLKNLSDLNSKDLEENKDHKILKATSTLTTVGNEMRKEMAIYLRAQIVRLTGGESSSTLNKALADLPKPGSEVTCLTHILAYFSK